MSTSSSINLENWLALYHSEGVGLRTFLKFIAHDPTLNILPENIKPNWIAVQRDLKWLHDNTNAKIITLHDQLYPAQLKQIKDPPPLLYVLGDAHSMHAPQLAMVGSRDCTLHGKQHAENFAQKVVQRGLTVTSGLAIGIDAASHSGALHANGQTIAVLAHGLDYIYPKQHKQLAAKIMQHGCLVSEFPIGIIPLAKYFPRRNRIISGLSLGVLVVEADIKSGSLITAQYAIDQGREVFAIPGSINHPKTRGCHYLIKNGAKLVECLEDVLEELVGLLNHDIRDKYADVAKVSLSKAALSAREQQFLEFIDYDSTCVDLIVARTGLPSSAVGVILLELELQGVITAVPGGYARTSD